MTQFETFALDYLTTLSGKKQNNYLLVINGVTVTTVITSKKELDEAIEGTLAINADSDIQVFELTEYSPEEIIETSDSEGTDETPVESTIEDCQDEPDTNVKIIEEPAVKIVEESIKEIVEHPTSVEPTKDLPRKAKKKSKKKKPKKSVGTSVKKVIKSVGDTQKVAKLHSETRVVIKKYDSITHAAEDAGIVGTNISKVCRGIRKNAGGFGWKYL